MSMLAIQRSTGNETACTPNFLPCAIKHNGIVNASQRYWKPEADDAGKHAAYFRGRKLEGRLVKLPEGYQGKMHFDIEDAVLSELKGISLEKSDKLLPIQPKGLATPEDDTLEDEDDVEEAPEETKRFETQSTFDEFIVWGHEALPEASEDPYVRGVEEWMTFAEAVRTSITNSI